MGGITPVAPPSTCEIVAWYLLSLIPLKCKHLRIGNRLHEQQFKFSKFVSIQRERVNWEKSNLSEISLNISQILPKSKIDFFKQDTNLIKALILTHILHKTTQNKFSYSQCYRSDFFFIKSQYLHTIIINFSIETLTLIFLSTVS